MGVVADDAPVHRCGRCPVKAIPFGVAFLVCAIPAFGQVDSTLQPSTGIAPAIPGNCEAALVTPGVPSGIVVVTVPTPAAHPGGVVGSARPFGTPSGLTSVYPGSTNHSASTAPGVIWGGGSVSGIGAMATSGVGTMTSSGIGSMERSGIGTIASSNVGSFGASPGLAPVSAPSPSPIFAPSISQPGPGAKGNAVAHRQPGTQSLAFICP